MVSVPALYSHDPSSNPAEVYIVRNNYSGTKTKISKKQPRMAHLKRSDVILL